MEIIYLYKPDKKQCITVYNEADTRYIASGKNGKLPDTNYIKLDISDVDPLGDALHICWVDDIGWSIVVHNSKVIESRLDTLKFNFSNVLPTDSIGIPTEKKFRGEGCAIFDFYRMRLSPNKGAVVEY